MNATHDHTQVAGFHDDSNALWLKDFRQGESDLFGQTLLDLESAREHLGNTGQLREAENAAIGNVTNVHLHKSVMVHHGERLVYTPFQ